MKSVISIVVIGLISFMIGHYWPSKSNLQNLDSSNDTMNASQDEQVEHSNAINHEQTSISSLNDKKTEEIILDSSLDPLVKNNKFEEKVKLLKQYFPQTKTGKEFVKMFTFMSMQEMAGTPESKAVDDAWEYVNDNPKESIDLFLNAYQDLPVEFTGEITDSIQLLSRVELSVEDRADFLMKIAQNQIKSEKQSFIPTVAVFSMRMMPEGKEILKENIDSILKAQKNNQDVIVSIIHEYGAAFPDDVKRLENIYLNPGLSKH